MNLILDTLSGASAEYGFEDSKIVRGGLVTDIPAQVRSDPFVLNRAILEAGGPTFGEPHPSAPNLRLRRIVAKPTSGTDSAELEYHYEGRTGSDTGGGVLLTVEDNTTLVTEQESVDLNGALIQAIFKYQVKVIDAGYSTTKEKPKARTVTMPVVRPRRTLSVSGLIFGRKLPAVWSRQAVGQVNGGSWPTGSLWSQDQPDGPGYWLCTAVDSSVDRNKYAVFDDKVRPYRMRAQFSSKVFRDWSHVGFFRDYYGHIPDLSKDAAAIKALIESPYEMGQKQTVNGVVKVGLYRTTNFPAIFGF